MKENRERLHLSGILLSAPAALSMIMLAAHFYRGGNAAVAIACLHFPLLLLSKRILSIRVVQGTLFFAGLIWINTIMTIYKARVLVAEPWLAASLAVSTSIAVMHATKTLHPPGGATALIAVIGSEKIHALGFFYVLVPVASGALLMLAVALLVNNIPGTRRYPEFWI